MKIVVGQGSCGIAAGAGKVFSALEAELKGSGIDLGVTGCIGMCYLEPIVDIYEDDALIQRLVHVSAADAEAIVAACIGGAMLLGESLTGMQLFGGVLIGQLRKINPILLILLSALLGIVIYH